MTGQPGCSGAVTLYGKPKEDRILLGESYDPSAPAASVYRVQLSIDNKDALTTNVVGSCTFFNDAACGFNGGMTRDPVTPASIPLKENNMQIKSIVTAIILLGLFPVTTVQAQMAAIEREFQQLATALKANDAERRSAIATCIG